jgi:hypothetical protein
MSASRRASAARSARCLTVDPNLYSRDLDPIPMIAPICGGRKPLELSGSPHPPTTTWSMGRRLWRENRAEQRIFSPPVALAFVRTPSGQRMVSGTRG